jgi:hypothetical protein
MATRGLFQSLREQRPLAPLGACISKSGLPVLATVLESPFPSVKRQLALKGAA